MSKSIHIHFICTGNAYRSRLAEGYLKSLGLPHIKVSSSGTEAHLHKASNGPLSWYAGRLAKKYNFIQYMSFTSKKTTIKHINKATLVIFMHPDNYIQYQKNFSYPLNKYEVWDIQDLHHLGFKNIMLDSSGEAELIKVTEETFVKIKDRVNDLVKNIRRSVL